MSKFGFLGKFGLVFFWIDEPTQIKMRSNVPATGWYYLKCACQSMVKILSIFVAFLKNMNFMWKFGFLISPKSKCVPTSLLLAGTTWNVRVNGRGNIGTLVQIIPPPFCYAPSFLTRNELNICEVLRVLICPFPNMVAKFCQQKVHWNYSQIESKKSSSKVAVRINPYLNDGLLIRKQ